MCIRDSCGRVALVWCYGTEVLWYNGTEVLRCYVLCYSAMELCEVRYAKAGTEVLRCYGATVLWSPSYGARLWSYAKSGRERQVLSTEYGAQVERLESELRREREKNQV
eukprot:2902776-Rhodomonas_salina.1